MLSELKALIVVDLQKDFCPGGTLAVTDGNLVIPVVKKLVSIFREKEWPIFFTRDWHPEDHCSFLDNSGIWPPHCVANSEGAAFPENLNIPQEAIIIDKATKRDSDAYSGFDNTELDGILNHKGIKELIICGLATDYCVKETVLDALKKNFKVTVISDATKAVNLASEDGARALDEMASKGASIYTLEEWLNK